MNNIAYFLILPLLLFFVLTPHHAILAANLSLTGEPNATIYTPYTVGIVLSGGEDTLGTDAIILYDPTMLKAVSVSEGTLYPTYNPSTNARINQEKGRIVLSGSTGFNSLVKATGVFGKITFTPRKKGKTVLKFDYVKNDTSKSGIVDAIGNDLISLEPTALTVSVAPESPIASFLRLLKNIFKK
jgi:hypothetical protein